MKNSAAIFISLLLIGCTTLIEPKSYDYDASAILDQAANLIRANYPFLVLKHINIDSLHQIYAARLSDYDNDKIYDLLFEFLLELKDGHVWFFTPGGLKIKPYMPKRTKKDKDSYNPEVVRRYFQTPLQLDKSRKIEYGITTERIGYIYISTFENDGSRWIEKFTPIMQQMKNTKGLILDVRHNEGGSDLFVNYVIGHFINTPVSGPIWIDAGGNQLERQKIYPHGNIYYTKKVAILQNGVCFSATEGFINVMNQLPNVVTIGDTTAGGGGAPLDFDICDGFTIHLPIKAQLTFEGKYIEWNGLAPDFLVPQTKSDIDEGRDFQLEKALKILRNGE